MANATIKRSRLVSKESLRVVNVDPLECVTHWDRLDATDRTVTGSYEEARAIKRQIDSCLDNRRGLIAPLVDGWEVRQVHDDPRQRLGRSSDVLDLCIQAEELGVSVLELMGYNPGLTMRSSGNARQRCNHANAIAEDGYRRSQAAGWGSLE